MKVALNYGTQVLVTPAGRLFMYAFKYLLPVAVLVSGCAANCEQHQCDYFALLSCSADKRNAYEKIACAAECDDVNAVFAKGVCLYLGRGTSFDEDGAERALLVAHEHGHPCASYVLYYIYKNKFVSEGDFNKKCLYLEKAFAWREVFNSISGLGNSCEINLSIPFSTLSPETFVELYNHGRVMSVGLHRRATGRNGSLLTPSVIDFVFYVKRDGMFDNNITRGDSLSHHLTDQVD